ncbi:hypothetical protein MVEG_10528 [Podila verticillata NRRL 6337]|nr:hypothetical protein MVEG_10528 [Podila verticillata NRRL 6337]
MATILVPLPSTTAASMAPLLPDLEAMLLKTGLGHLQPNTSDPRMREGIVDLLIDLPQTRSGSPTFAVICVQSDHSLEVEEIPRIDKCVRRYQAHTIVLFMVQSLATLQSFEQLLIDRVVRPLVLPMRSPTRLTTPPTSTLSITTMTTKSSALLPRVAPCFSAQDAILYLQRLLEAHLHASPRTPSREHTPLHQQLVNLCGPIASAQECDQLGAGLGTLQNIGLASSSEIRNTCRLRTQLISTIYDFFETDQPL